MPRNTDQEPGTAGRWNDEGKVYILLKKENGKKYYKIGCSEDPHERLGEIQDDENDRSIKLIQPTKATKMRDAEAAAQQAAERLRFKKDPKRGGATDWFKAPARFSEKKLKRAVQKAVYACNRRNK